MRTYKFRFWCPWVKNSLLICRHLENVRQPVHQPVRWNEASKLKVSFRKWRVKSMTCSSSEVKLFGSLKVIRLFPYASKKKFTLTATKTSSLYPSVVPCKLCSCEQCSLVSMVSNEKKMIVKDILASFFFSTSVTSGNQLLSLSKFYRVWHRWWSFSLFAHSNHRQLNGYFWER